MASIIAVAIAHIINNAIDIREKSFDHTAANAASEKAEADRKANPGCHYTGHVDFSTFYRKTLEQSATEAANEAGEPDLGDLVYFMLANSWNDVGDWAARALGRKVKLEEAEEAEEDAQ
jgi:hypothetical protein